MLASKMPGSSPLGLKKGGKTRAAHDIAALVFCLVCSG
ncbi:hypothetical protein ASZ90_017190 [hydrocarbon metagenome]|uniref:Uncharacterized protein n=1 Tax=hydrocarbon metagenome TaxID=938273 RepID=A0A0W8E9V0_9ZZZZ